LKSCGHVEPGLQALEAELIDIECELDDHAHFPRVSKPCCSEV
jgi:hypothetical protein